MSPWPWALAAGMMLLPPGIFEGDSEHLLEQARLSRQRLDFAAANAALDEAAKDPSFDAATQAERGLLARDRGDLEHALALLTHAADLDPLLPARLDQAGVLVQLGRWPEAVEVLRQALDERGMSLPVDLLTADNRFVKLASLAPYKEVIAAARAEQAGPTGRILMRLERLQGSATAAERGVHKLSGWLVGLRTVLAEKLTAVVALVLLGLLFGTGVRELHLLRPPWALMAGVVLADAFWALWMHALTDGADWGRDAIVVATTGVVGLWALGATLRMAWFRLQRARRGARDPFAGDNLVDTLVLVDEVSRLGHRVVTSRRQQRVLVEALRQAGETLRDRLDSGA